VLHNLTNRRQPSASIDREPVLTVGNPSYALRRSQLTADDERTVDQLTARSRYGNLGGQLTQLSYSGWEVQWISGVFGKNGIRAAQLTGGSATEANVRSEVTGRRVIHLACHGLTDEAYGNFFGALALAPGRRPNDPADDGFLTLAEIYELNLSSCELAILSACETNFGPEQRGEGVWALSRGFLVAGTRRVIASNWLVDDEAAASLITYACSILAKAERKGEKLNAAQALHKAKKWVREQEKWRSPYYWGTFALVGPD
jgi:CHAT domain-containing protein